MKTKHKFIKGVLSSFTLFTVGILPILSSIKRPNIFIILPLLVAIFFVLYLIVNSVFSYMASHATIQEKITIAQYEELNDVGLSFLATTVTLLTMAKENILLMIILYIFCGYLFYITNIYYSNPLFHLWGYKAYKIVSTNGVIYYAIAKKNKLVKDAAKCFYIEDNVLFLINM